MPMRLLSMLRTRLFGDPGPSGGGEAAGAGSADAAREQARQPGAVPGPLPTPDSPATPDDVDPRDDVGTPDQEIAARQERAASRILEDERLRGDLTDEEFQPLLDWALRVTGRAVETTAGLGDRQADERIEEAMRVVREIVGAAGAAVSAHNEGDADRRASELQYIGSQWRALPPDVAGETPADSVVRQMSALAGQLDAAPDLSGPAVAALLVATLTSPPPGQPGTGSPPPSQAGAGQGVGDAHQEDRL